MNAQLMQEGFGLVGTPVHSFEAFRQYQAAQFQESGTTSDFPNYLHENIVKPRFFTAFAAATSQWRRYTAIENMPDFKTMTTVGLGEFPDLAEVLEDDDYQDSAIGEITGPGMRLGTFGKTFSIGRRVLINDEFGKIIQAPTMMARAAARTLSKQIVGILQNNPLSYDGVNNLFSVAHGNLLSSALSETTLPAAITAIQTQTSQLGERIELNPTMIVLPTQLRFTAARLLQSTVIPQPGTGLGGVNPMAGILEPVYEPYLTDANDWYVFTSNDPELAPVKAGFLNGKEDPTLLLETGPNVVGGGGTDPYQMTVDKLTWKVRHDWATAAGEWRGAVKSVV